MNNIRIERLIDGTKVTGTATYDEETDGWKCVVTAKGLRDSRTGSMAPYDDLQDMIHLAFSSKGMDAY